MTPRRFGYLFTSTVATYNGDMTAEERDKLESLIKRHHENGDHQRAVTAALEGYGPEILGFLVGLHRDHELASEVFSQFTEDLWRGIGSFDWRSSFRTWAYALARNAGHRLLRDPRRKRGRRLHTEEMAELADRVRSSTLPHLKTEMKDGISRLRKHLDEDEQTLLILRVDRRMSWKEVASIMLDDPDAHPGTVRRKSAALRKRFERVKDKLRELAASEGLLTD